MDNSPNLLSLPGQGFGVLVIIAKRILAELAHSTDDYVLDSLLYGLAVLDLVHKLFAFPQKS